MSLTTRVLIGLVLGLLAGIGISMSDSQALAAISGFIAPIGTLWINAIRMTVIPLVVSSLIVGVSSAPDVRSVGRVGGRAVIIFLVTVFISATFASVVGQPLFSFLPIDPGTAAALRESGAAATAASGASAASIPTFSQWLISLVPTNPVQAMADGAILPLIIFTVAFGIALLALPLDRRAPVVAFFTAVFDATLTLVRWVLELAPIGVFALALPLAAAMGLSSAGSLAYYIVMVSVAAILFAIVVLYPAAWIIGRTPLGRFARASAPAQAVALSARSSLASLPAMMEGATDVLKLPTSVTSFFLPLAASTFRAGTGIGVPMGALFLARLYDVPLGTAQIGAIILTTVLISFSVPGIPGGSIIVMIPVLQAAGIPDAGIGLLLGIDTIPDMFRTATNVTGDMAAATIVSRGGAAGGGDTIAIPTGEATAV